MSADGIRRYLKQIVTNPSRKGDLALCDPALALLESDALMPIFVNRPELET